MERSILNIKRLDKIRSSKIRKKTKIIDVLDYALKSKWRWAGHVARMNSAKWTKAVTLWCGPRGKRKRGRPKMRWSDELEAVAKNWSETAQDRDRWNKLEEAFTQQGS